MTTTTFHVNLVDAGPVELSVAEYGEGQPFLLLHGGGGPDTVARFAELFANTHPVRVITPIHPGFGGTPRPEGGTPSADISVAGVIAGPRSA